MKRAAFFAQVANAMQAMNEAGFVHADMKPNNIIVDDNGNAKIIDLGQCCPIGTIKKRIQGTPDYIAPEQVRRFPLDARTDVYNFGASLYWTLTGKPIPTILAKPGSMTVPGQNAMATPPEKLNADVPPLLSRLILDCIRLQPVERPASMREVSMRLGLILQKLLVPAS
ncbi:MAG TPA: protein kinase [Phycisphaerae bacterium]|nr:protein kinase [Phycisphaerae bacterium]